MPFRRSYGFGPVRYATRAAFLAAPVAITVSPASVSLLAGQTQQLTTTATNFLGEPITATIAWTTPDASVATVSSTGLVTAIGDTTVAITATSGNASGTSAVTSIGELTYLRTNISGGDTALPAIYSVRTGLTSAGGTATQWDDARGSAGYGPSWAPGGEGGSTGLAVGNASDPATRYLTGGTGRGMQTAVSARLALASSAPAYAIVAIQNSPVETNSQRALMLAGDSAVNGSFPQLWFGELSTMTGPTPGGIVTEFFDQPASTALNYPHQKAGPKMRLFVPSVSDGFSRMDASPFVMDDSVMALNNAGVVALNPGAPTDHPAKLMTYQADSTQIRAIVALSRRPTTADLAALETWANVYHGAIVNTATMVMFDGDSITQGGATTDYRHGWPEVVMARAPYANVTFANWAQGGSYIGNWPTVTNESFQSGMARRTPFILDAFARNTNATKKVVFLSGGTNDISYHLDGYDLTELIRRLWQNVDLYTAAGITPIVCTVIANALHDTPTKVNAWTGFNAEIRANAAAHGAVVCDFASLPDVDAIADTSDVAKYVDGTHPTNATNIPMADLADTTLAAVLASL